MYLQVLQPVLTLGIHCLLLCCAVPLDGLRSAIANHAEGQNHWNCSQVMGTTFVILHAVLNGPRETRRGVSVS